MNGIEGYTMGCELKSLATMECDLFGGTSPGVKVVMIKEVFEHEELMSLNWQNAWIL